MISLKRRTNCLLVVMSVFFLFLTSYQANALSFNVYETDVMEFDDLFESFSDHDIQGDYAYVVSHNELFIFDISDPTNLSEVSSLEVNATIRDAAINGDYVYIGYSEGLQIVDVSDRANPELVEVLDDGVAFFALDAHDNILCLTSIGFHIYDISDPTVPVELSSIENVASVEAKISGDYIYCAARGIQGSGLRIIDISDPENAFETANVLGFPSAVAIDVHDDIAAIVGGQDFGEVFRLFDVSDPSNPIERCLFETPPGIIPGGFTDVLLQDNIMVAMHNDTYMRVFDISNPENPIESGRIDVTQFVQYLDFASESVVAMAEWDQYRTLDVSFAQNAYYLNAEDTGFYQILEIENITRDGQPMDIGTSVAVFDGNFLVGTNTHM
ncbi:hypothetical protein K8I28_09235, partial [bacterium]|nr:hypothetical protein [bacterium]